jgi:tRNA threonylcarbamoyladenosine biosynthesis protein TsaE
VTAVEHISTHIEQTMAIAGDLASRLQPGDIVTLTGELGAGKTQFVRGLARGLGIDPRDVSSPTFVLCQEYQRRERGGSESGGNSGADAGRERIATLIHIDAYRMSGPDELDTIGWEEMHDAGDAVIAIEWPQRIAAALPAQRIDVTIEHLADTERRIAIDFSDNHHERHRDH